MIDVFKFLNVLIYFVHLSWWCVHTCVYLHLRIVCIFTYIYQRLDCVLLYTVTVAEHADYGKTSLR